MLSDNEAIASSPEGVMNGANLSPVKSVGRQAATITNKTTARKLVLHRDRGSIAWQRSSGSDLLERMRYNQLKERNKSTDQRGG